MNKTRAAYGVGGFISGVVITLVVIAVMYWLYLAAQRAGEYAGGPEATLERRSTAPVAVVVVTATHDASQITPASAFTATPSPVAPASTPADAWPVSVVSAAMVKTTGVLHVTFDVRQTAGDVLFEPPVLQVDEQSFVPTPDSLKAAKFAILDAITRGQARASLDFAIGGIGQSNGRLIFNPTGAPGSIVNPRIELPVAWGVPTPTPSR